MNRIIVAVLLLCVVVGCNQQSSDTVEPTLNREAQPISVTVHFHPDVRSVTEAYRQSHGISRFEQVPNMLGFAVWPQWVDRETGEWVDRDDQLSCEIHSVTPKRVDDEATLTLGHEMLHCVYGSYHQ